METLHFLLVPFALSLVLSGIHVYLGLHVLSRGVIFVDLALAQIAALGMTIAFLLGHDLSSPFAYFYALGFTVVGAIIFSLTRGMAGRVPQEALIGIAYVVASAGVILAVDRAPHGAEHLKALLVRDILWVQDLSTVVKLLAIYGVIGLLHFLLRRPIFLATFSPTSLSRHALFLSDLFFYCTFGIVVTSSVQVAGVLLVFSYLIIPSAMAALLATSVGRRLAIGWICAFIVSVAGLYLSFAFDLPTGASIIVTFGVGLILVGLLTTLLGTRAKKTLSVPDS